MALVSNETKSKIHTIWIRDHGHKIRKKKKKKTQAKVLALGIPFTIRVQKDVFLARISPSIQC